MLANRERCTGCMACLNVCHTGSIKFVSVEGCLHTYPEINPDTCVKCGQCEKVCVPLHPEYLRKEEPFAEKYYCAWDTNEQSRMASTSGGVASALARFAIQNGYYVAGAAFDEKWHLSHMISNSADIVEKLRGSKYLLSDAKGIYNETRKILQNGERVLFYGTPCEISALYSIVKPSLRENLITCGIICHGVNAPDVWEDYVKYLENKYKSRLISYNFRSKKKGWGTLQIEYTFDNGKKVSQPARKNLFHVWFGRHFMLRESCFNCIFRTKERYSDLVIGDFWGIEKVNPELYDKKGVSVLIVSSQKGEDFIKSTDIMRIETDSLKTPNVLKGYLPIDKDASGEINRSKVFAYDYRKLSFDKMKSAYSTISLGDLLIASIKHKLKLQ